MMKFSEFGIKPRSGRFVGKSIEMNEVIGEEIIVHDYKIKKSKFPKDHSDKCLYIQIEYKERKRLLFTGSKILTDILEQVPKENFPFKTVITREGKSLQFT